MFSSVQFPEAVAPGAPEVSVPAALVAAPVSAAEFSLLLQAPRTNAAIVSNVVTLNPDASTCPPCSGKRTANADYASCYRAALAVDGFNSLKIVRSVNLENALFTSSASDLNRPAALDG